MIRLIYLAIVRMGILLLSAGGVALTAGFASYALSNGRVLTGIVSLGLCLLSLMVGACLLVYPDTSRGAR